MHAGFGAARDGDMHHIPNTIPERTSRTRARIAHPSASTNTYSPPDIGTATPVGSPVAS